MSTLVNNTFAPTKENLEALADVMEPVDYTPPLRAIGHPAALPIAESVIIAVANAKDAHGLRVMARLSPPDLAEVTTLILRKSGLLP